MNPDEFRRKYGIDSSDQEREHSLRENSWERAVRLHQPNAGTPHDWEEWEHASERYGVEVETGEDESDPTRSHHEEAEMIDDRPTVMDWLITRWRRLRKRVLGH